MNMRYFLGLLVLLCLASCSGGGGSGDSGPSLSNDACSAIGLPTRIIDGSACGNSSSSPVVKIVLFDVFGAATGLCTGTMLTSRDVLTAAHCFPSGIVAAAVDINNTLVFADTVTAHSGFFEDETAVAAFNDVAVMSLDSALSLPTLPIYVGPALAKNDIISVFGYGLDENEGLGELKSGEMSVTEVTDNHIFSTFNGEGSNTCQGDSGGPAITTESGPAAVAGITSTGTLLSCAKGDTSLFTNIQSESVLNFILSVVPGVATV